MENERKTLLTLLEKQGQDFSTQFPAFFSNMNFPKPKQRPKFEIKECSNVAIDLEEEWLGFSDTMSSSSVIPEVSKKGPEIVTFSDALSKAAAVQHKDLFMSSKISKLKELRHETKPLEGDEFEEESNIRNDALLHRLVHTKILAESLKNEISFTSAARRHKALAGRIMELRGDAKLGKGEVLVRKTERNRANKSVREGILSKENKKREKALAEAKEAGNYHSSLRKVYHGEMPHRRDRERGLSMGVGRFKGGILKLSKLEIKSAEGNASVSGFKKRIYKKNL